MIDAYPHTLKIRNLQHSIGDAVLDLDLDLVLDVDS
jgi:hypothetical protein